MQPKGDNIKTRSNVDPSLLDTYWRIPLHFIQNEGEVDKDVRFYEKGSSHTTFFTREGVYLALSSGQGVKGSKNRGQGVKGSRGEALEPWSPRTLGPSSPPEVIRLSFIDANKNPEIIGEGIQEGKVNYFTGSDPSKWKANIPTYKAVVYKDIYPGIDIKFYGNNQELEYDIIVKPGADPTRVRLSYEGIEGLIVTEKGDLEIDLTPLSPPLLRGDIRGVASSPAGGEGRKGGGKTLQKRPYIYQEIEGKRVEVEGRFKVQGSKFKTKDVIARREIPRLSLRGTKSRSNLNTGSEQAPQSHIYGKIASPSARNDEVLQSVFGFEVASYDKRYPLIIDPVLVYSTYLGGMIGESSIGIALDSSGNIYVSGITESANIPTKNPLQPDFGRGMNDAFVAKINPEGSALIYSTYLGGRGTEFDAAIAVDSSGNAYVTGRTSSADFPTKNPLQRTLEGEFDAFVAKINPEGSALVYSTYLGGSNVDDGLSIAVDASGNAYITGYTYSTNFPQKNPLQPAYGGGYADAFVTKLNPDGSAIVYSTYLGGSLHEFGFGIAVDPTGSAYVTGDLRSTDFPTKNPLQHNRNEGYDAFVAKINPTGSALVYSTYLGGDNHDNGYGIAVDSSGNAYVTGLTSSTDFPTKNPLQPALGGRDDAFITKLDPTGSLIYSTYLGGSSFDDSRGIALDPSRNVLLIGRTNSADFPTKNPLQRTLGGEFDAFVAKINPTGSALVYSTYLGGSNLDEGRGIAVDSSGNATVIGHTASDKFPIKKPLQRELNGDFDAFVVKIADRESLKSSQRRP